MAQAETGLLRRQGKCAGKPCRINEIRPELVFREIPGKPVQRRGQPQRFGRGLVLRRALVDPPGDGVARVPAAPTALGLLPPRRLTCRLPAGMLAVPYSRIRPEPPAADRTRSLPGLWHGDPSWSPPVSPDRLGLRSKCLGQFWKAEVGKFSQAPKGAHPSAVFQTEQFPPPR